MNDWEIWDQDSCSVHIIRYIIGQDSGYNSAPRNQETRYIVKRHNINKFQTKLARLATASVFPTHKQEDTGDLDSTMAKRATSGCDVEKTIDEFYEDLTAACNESFRTQLTLNKATTNRSVPWWTDELTIMRRVNVLRRYQRTTNNEELRTQRKAQYLEGKARYASTIKYEKFSSWKAFCNLTPGNNPWNEVYKLVAGKRKTKTLIFTEETRRNSNEGHSRHATAHARTLHTRRRH